MAAFLSLCATNSLTFLRVWRYEDINRFRTNNSNMAVSKIIGCISLPHTHNSDERSVSVNRSSSSIGSVCNFLENINLENRFISTFHPRYSFTPTREHFQVDFYRFYFILSYRRWNNNNWQNENTRDIKRDTIFHVMKIFPLFFFLSLPSNNSLMNIARAKKNK